MTDTSQRNKRHRKADTAASQEKQEAKEAS